MTLKQIREDLRAIRYYYTRKEYFDAVTQIVGNNCILEKAKMYNDAVKSAPPRQAHALSSLPKLIPNIIQTEWDLFSIKKARFLAPF